MNRNDATYGISPEIIDERFVISNKTLNKAYIIGTRRSFKLVESDAVCVLLTKDNSASIHAGFIFPDGEGGFYLNPEYVPPVSFAEEEKSRARHFTREDAARCTILSQGVLLGTENLND